VFRGELRRGAERPHPPCPLFEGEETAVTL
jgi:hypothetical protein